MADNYAARKDSDYLIISMVPDICLTPVGSAQVPVPYPVSIDLSSCNNESPNVYFNGNAAFIFSSDTVKTRGDEAGTGKGIKSGTKGGKAEPKEHSSSFFVNGKPVIRVNDLFYMNNRNTLGILIHSPPIPAKAITDSGMAEPVPEQALSWYESAWQTLEETGSQVKAAWDTTVDAAVQLDEEYRILVRGEGLVTGVFGVVEVGFGAVGMMVPEPTTLTKIGGGLLIANGADNASTGFKQLWTGESQQTLLEQGVTTAANMAGLPPEAAEAAATAISLISAPTRVATNADGVVDAVAGMHKAGKTKKHNKPDNNAAASQKGKSGAAAKGNPKPIPKRKGDCAESLVEQQLRREGWRLLRGSKTLKNGSGHGLDLIMQKDDKLLIVEVKANGAKLNKQQKKGGEEYLRKQLADMRRGQKGKGRYKVLKNNKVAKHALKKTQSAIKENNFETKLYKVQLEDDPHNTYENESCKARGEIKSSVW